MVKKSENQQTRNPPVSLESETALKANQPLNSSQSQQFMEMVDPYLKLPGVPQVKLRKEFGFLLDKHFRIFGKGSIQKNKSAFIERAIAATDLRWSSKEPFKIISTLKNSGNGDQEVLASLIFLSCKIFEFGDIRSLLIKAISDDHADLSYNQHWVPKPDTYFHDILRISNDRFGSKSDELAGNFATVVPMGLLQGGNFLETDAEIRNRNTDIKVAGRLFIENDLKSYITSRKNTDYSTLSIIDVDDMTKINKIYGPDLGDRVLGIVDIIIGYEAEKYGGKAGRCGDDTFYVVLCDQGMQGAIKIIEKIINDVKNYDWNYEAADLRVSISAGISKYRMFESSINLAIRAALGMKEAKRRRGDRAEIGPDFLATEEFHHETSTQRHWS